MNRLALETSPYLRGHRENPVDWYPWGPEAFELAVAEDKPILLSVGYNSCHWCHVMARESFEDEATAELMNRWFVNVKVDREERPDVDAVYMDVLVATTGRGGWPMTVFLTPDRKPFFAGTYFPKERGRGMPTFSEVLRQVNQAWQRQRGQVLMHAGDLTASLRARAESASHGSATLEVDELLARAAAVLVALFDERNGGFGTAPKFPHALAIDALLARSRTGDDEEAARIAFASLDAMARGGIYDHLGGGFARYSVDAAWLIPHFEKMLYDNALLARAYLHGWQLSGQRVYRQVLDETLGYVLRELGRPGGGFHGSESADSDGVEGAYYVWDESELIAVLGPEARAVAEWYGVTAEGNFDGRSVLFRPPGADLVRPEPIERGRQALLAARAGRPRPAVDDKVITEWNGMMVATLAEAAAATTDTRYLDAATLTAEFLLEHLRRPDGRWLRSWQEDGGARHPAFAADHAAIIDGFVRLAEASGRAIWIEEARSAADALLDLFWDDRDGGVFTTGSDAEELVVRPKDLIDSSNPSANNAAAIALRRLGALTGDARYLEAVDAIIDLAGEAPAAQPLAYGQLLSAIELQAKGADEVAIVGDRPDLVRAIHERYLPRVVLAWGEPYDSPLWSDRQDGLAYVCRQFACQLPTSDPDAMLAQLS